MGEVASASIFRNSRNGDNLLIAASKWLNQDVSGLAASG
ncbi:hypothetical protein KKY_1116 [Pelagibacterium halotolerans B2]|uniref:Uncharacterized protein n=1 Tax=Pelagibacterium halotolerans (strain DSM 22347 / JCM 15775 / CGMCC 1.7692 / B2) TaxID=1082931 RepID=G4R634_PELHB|nr:hypothetical protein KKY_1116 [Pelagibacterium halotolerans B2]